MMNSTGKKLSKLESKQVSKPAKKFSTSSLAKYLPSSRGATLVETLVAIALASVVLTAVVGMVVSAVSTSTLSKSRTTATRYAEEGVEVARKTRDRTDWPTFFNTYVGISSWQVDPSFNLTNGTGLPLPPFQRSIRLTDASNQTCGNSQGQNSGQQGNSCVDRVQVVTRVTWQDKGKTQQVELVTYLTKWRK